jgi:gluconokinase
MQSVLVMGVAGSGKTTLARSLAARAGLPFIEGDDLHDEPARAKMAAGIALTDADRAPWLDRCAKAVAPGGVLACSALKRAYRDRLRQEGGLHLVFCAITPEGAQRRLSVRAGHFFPTSLLPTQFAALEPPGPDEGAVIIDPALPPEAATLAAVRALGFFRS